MLTLDDVRANYGGLTALAGVSISIADGDFISIVGPNGACLLYTSDAADD